MQKFVKVFITIIAMLLSALAEDQFKVVSNVSEIIQKN